MDAPVTYEEYFIGPGESRLMFQILWNTLAWEQRPTAPRREYWHNTFDRPYTYGSGDGVRTYEPQPNHELIEVVRQHLLDRTGIFYEGCFLNGYATGKDALGWHADDDPGIDHSRPIAIVSLYEDGDCMFGTKAKGAAQPREIYFREGREGVIEKLTLGQGSLAVMQPGMQQTHFHKIPRAGAITCPRISLTFRGLK
jgi:alkylated DNA repair dioxygenase AlkB